MFPKWESQKGKFTLNLQVDLSMTLTTLTFTWQEKNSVLYEYEPGLDCA